MPVEVQPDKLSRREVGVWRLSSPTARSNPFTEVSVLGCFTARDGRVLTQEGFHAGDGTWEVRFSPDTEGGWEWSVESVPPDPDLAGSGTIEVGPSDRPGHVRVTPDRNWGLSFEDGTAALAFGDTVYNLFAMAHCGYDVEAFLRRRTEQGFTLVRVRVPVSPFHPERAVSEWQTRRCLAWEGVEQYPLFDRFNLDWFATVDRVVQLCEELGLGLELIMEAWGFEFPFNARTVFTAEDEDLWLRYLVARYDAYGCVWAWTPMNEYENYPQGTPTWSPLADRWLLRVADLIDRTGAHGHVIAAHNGPTLPPFAQRFAAAPGRVGLVMFQQWGTSDAELGWLAGGIEESMAQSFEGWPGARVLAEWGYERNPQFELSVPWHEHTGVEHTRRGAWRGVFQAAGVIHGFENTWGPWCELETDQAGMRDLCHVRHFLTEVVDFTRLAPADALVGDDAADPARRARVLASPERDLVAVYLPVGGNLRLPEALSGHSFSWYDPRTGDLLEVGSTTAVMAPPASASERDDWVAILTRSGGE